VKPETADRLATVAFWLLGGITVSVLLAIVLQIFARGLLTALNPEFLLGKPEAMKEGGGILPMIVSSLYLTGLTLLIALPVSLGTAIYLAEYAREGKLTNVIRFCVDSLASLPSIVFGIFGMTLFVIFFGWGYSLLAGAFTCALLNLPTLMRSSEESVLSVPGTYREASFSLGATRWTTVRQVVLPSATPGILAGTMLSIGRIMGESAAIVYTAGLFVRTIPLNPMDTAAPLAGYIWYAQTEALIPDFRRVVDGSAGFLLLLVLLMNFLARRLARYYQRKKLAGGENG
jgi:phosphate transport system permease protein